MPARVFRHRWALIIGVWTVPAMLATFETYMFWRMAGHSHPLWRAALMEGSGWLVYALLTPSIFAFGRRRPLQGADGRWNLARHVLAALLAGAAYSGLAATFSWTFSPTPPTSTLQLLILRWFLSSLPLTTLTYFGILGVGAAIDHLGEARRRETDAARLAAQLAEARLGALQMQLHPHFLFNTLNAITVLARDHDTRGTVTMLTLLSDLLRDVLRTDTAQQVPLEQELAFARRYLDIELVRFADRLRVRETVDNATLRALVPVFVLQPLIENAVRHGIAGRAAGGTLHVGAREVSEAGLELWVDDDGAGLPADWSGGDDYGIGLSNTAARLRALYGASGSLSVDRREGGGTSVTVRLPRVLAPATAERERTAQPA